MKGFRQSMEYSHQMSIRIGRRTAQMIRLDMLSVLILDVVMAYRIATMASDFSHNLTHDTNVKKYAKHGGQFRRGEP